MGKPKRSLEMCPQCGLHLSEALSRYFWRMMPGTEFEYTCGGCGATMMVEVVSLPQFYCEAMVEAGQLALWR